ncbi:MAG: beta strand repeat-containing protein [Candidatus Nealsonbacteria bacterium]
MIKIKKIVAIITTFTFLFTAAGPAASATIEELQAQIADLLALISSLSSQLAALQGGTGTTISGCTISSFTRSLKTGMSGDDVKCLQIVLNTDSATQVASSGVGSPGNETSYFGSLTTAAVIKFQEKYASEVLATYGLTSGTGYVGTTTKAKLNSLLGAGAGAGTGEVGTAAAVSLASDTPGASQIAKASQDVIFTKIRFSAGATAYTVSKIIVARGGVSADADIASIKLYDGLTQVGSTQALNTTTHRASFTGLSWEIPSYSVKYLTIKGSIASAPTVGDSVRLGIAAATDITASVTPSGTFPMMGSAKTIAGISVGTLGVDVQTTPATNTILSGATDQEMACWRFTASTTEGFNVHSVKVTHIGSATRDDVKNIALKVTGTQIGSTVASLDTANAATFDLSSSPLSILASSAKTVCAYADIAEGIWTSRTVKFEITQYTDVTAYGANSGGIVTITYGGTAGTAFVKQTGNTMTLGQGALTVAIDAAENPSDQNYVKGTTNRLISAVKFSTGSREGARIVRLRFTLVGSATDISNVTLWDGTTQIAGPASVIGSYVSFGMNTIGWDTSSLFDVEASQNKTIIVKADIPSGATALQTIKLSLASGDTWADGLSSQYDLPTGSITGSTTGSTHTVIGSGSLAVSLSSDTPPAQVIVKGAVNKVLAKFNLSAGSGEDITVSSILIRCYVGTGTGTACTNGTTTNVKLLKSNGSQYGSTVSNPTASASFGGSLIVGAAQTETLSLVADIPTGSGAASVHFSIDETGTTILTDLTSTGVSSAADIEETGAATGKLIILGAGTVGVAAAATPGDQTLIGGATQVSFVDLVFSAGTAEDVRITRIKLNSATTNKGTTTDIAHITLYDGSTQLTVQKSLTASTSVNHYVVFSSSDFIYPYLGAGITIAKGQQKRITVKADVASTASSANTIALGIAHDGNVTFVGLSSNTTPTPTITASGALTGANYIAGSTGHVDLNLVTLAENGILTVSTNADTPIAAIQSVSKAPVVVTGVAFHKSQFAATYEDIDVKSISITRSGGSDADFAYITLWDGSTQLGSAQTLTNGSSTFNFATENYWRIPAGGAKYLTIKADLNGIGGVGGYGASTGDAPKLGVDTTVSEGVASGVAPTNDGEQDKLGNFQYLRQTQPTIALASPTSGTYGAGTQELIRWTVSADQTGALGWEKIVFDVSGSVIITSAGPSYTVGCVTGNSTCTVKTDGVWMSTGTDPVVLQLIATSSMQVWDVDSNTQVVATTTATAWTVDQDTSAGTARVSFVAYPEQQVALGTTKTYKLLGTVLQGSGQTGSSLMTKIADRSDTAKTDTYAAVAGTAGVTFVWTDRSGAGGAHSAGSADWTHDFKVSGIPTATKTLSK